jgi:hypothetical protein
VPASGRERERKNTVSEGAWCEAGGQGGLRTLRGERQVLGGDLPVAAMTAGGANNIFQRDLLLQVILPLSKSNFDRCCVDTKR